MHVLTLNMDRVIVIRCSNLTLAKGYLKFVTLNHYVFSLRAADIAHIIHVKDMIIN